MVKIFVVDNGGQWTHREWRSLKYLGVDTKIVPNTIPFKDIAEEDIDGLVLSGGAPRIGVVSKLGNCGEYLEKADFPIIGICAGHQFTARYYGGKVKPSKIPEFGKVELVLIKEDDPLFKDVPKKPAGKRKDIAIRMEAYSKFLNVHHALIGKALIIREPSALGLSDARKASAGSGDHRADYSL